MTFAGEKKCVPTCVEIKFYGAFVVLTAIDATPARWRDNARSILLDRARTAASSPRNDLVKNCRVHPTHWLISTQVPTTRAGSATASAILSMDSVDVFDARTAVGLQAPSSRAKTARFASRSS